MLPICRNRWDASCFREKRMVFVGAEKAPAGLAKTREEITKYQAKALELLRDYVEGTSGPAKRGTHGINVPFEQRDTRTLTPPPKPQHEESVRIAEAAVNLKGSMERDEAILMQEMQEDAYEQYINPAFIKFLKAQPGLTDKAYPLLTLLVEHPFEFEYRNGKNHERQIVKRRPFTEANKNIPDDFMMVVEGSTFQVVKVKGTLTDKDDPNKKVPVDLDFRPATTGVVPWMDHPEYVDRRMPDDQERWKNEFGRYLYGEDYEKWDANNGSDEEWFVIVNRAYKKMPATAKDSLVLNNIDFPNKFISLINARNLAFEKDDPRFKAIEAGMKQQGANYDDLTSGNKLKIIVVLDPKIEGAYQIWPPSGRPLRVNKAGYFLIKLPDGSWKPDPRYIDAKRREYYTQRPEARTGLQTGEWDKMQQAINQAAQAIVTQKKAADAKEKRDRLDAKINAADLETLKKITLEVTKDEPGNFRQNIQNLKKEPASAELLRRAIAKRLNDHPERMQSVETILKQQEIQKKLENADESQLRYIATAENPDEKVITADAIKKMKKPDLLKIIKKWLDTGKISYDDLELHF